MPKFVPAIVTEEPTAPETGDRLAMVGGPAGSVIVNNDPALATPLTVTTRLPVVAPAGTVAAIDVALQLVIVAWVPLNVNVLVPWVSPKFVPVMVTEAPTAPEVGDKLTIEGSVPWELKITATLSKVAAAAAEGVPLLAKPTYTFGDMATV